jgi:hypothetical protein
MSSKTLKKSFFAQKMCLLVTQSQPPPPPKCHVLFEWPLTAYNKANDEKLFIAAFLNFN